MGNSVLIGVSARPHAEEHRGAANRRLLHGWNRAAMRLEAW